MSEKKQDNADVSCSDALASAQEDKIAEQEICRGAIEEKNKQIAQYHDQLLRMKAEFENFRKRVDREKRDYLAWGKEDIILKLIGLLDVFEQACQQASTTRNIEGVLQGLELLHREFDSFLKSEGVQQVPTKNEVFDPHVHEAISYVEVDEGDDNKIVEEFQRGYRFNNRIIRPAKVKVSKRIKKDESKEDKEASNNV